jgi:hypothetical protein
VTGEQAAEHIKLVRFSEGAEHHRVEDETR